MTLPSSRLPRRAAPIALALALAAALLAALAPHAAASPTQLSIMQDESELLRGGADLRNKRLDEFRALGVDVVKVRAEWRAIAPAGSSKPDGFNAADPSQYPSENWRPYDELVRGSADRGMRVLFMLGGRAPEWADGRLGPNAAEFGQFVQAIGTRYSGSSSYADALGGAGLPRVDLWSVWNEPNLDPWIEKQYSGSVPYSPRIYRGLVFAARDGLASSGHGADQMLIGELLPFARTSRSRDRVRPLEFLRELACVDRRFRAYRGSAARKRGCEGFRAIPGTGLAYHPYTLRGGPNVSQANRDDASIGQLSRITSTLDKLSKRRRLESGRMPLWLTEFGFQSNPPDRFQTPISQIPDFLGQSEWIAYRNSRVASYAQYPYVDDPSLAGFQSGLFFNNGEPKKSVLAAYRMPLFVDRRSSKTVTVFGGVRPASGGTVTVESRLGRRGKWRALGTVPLNASGYFQRVFRVSSPTKRYYRFAAGEERTRIARAR